MSPSDSTDFRSETVAGKILAESKVIAVVGLSPSPDRASHDVAAYLQSKGYRIIPIHPKAEKILGEPAYASLADVPKDVSIDVVCVFRRPEFALEHAEEAIEAGAKALWLQLGIVNDEAGERARAAGLRVVMDRCMKVDHAAGLGSSR